jgi:type VI secretion system ImpC/EvpB family protein/type VI secretion system ImpB/VipA family protein
MLRIVAIGDFSARSERKAPRIPVDKDRFEEVFARVSPSLELAVANRIGGPTPQLEVPLALSCWQDLSPGAIADAVPALAKLQELKRATAAVGRGELGVPAFRERAAELAPQTLAQALLEAIESSAALEEAVAPLAAPGRVAAKGGDLDAILGLVDAGGGAASAPRETARRLLGTLTARPSAGRSGEAKSGAAAAAAALDAVIAAQLDEILHAPEFRALESLWRGAKLLVDRTDFRKPIALELLGVGLEGAAEAVDGLADGEDADLVLAAYEVAATSRDIELAQALASSAERAQTPVALGVSPGFLGIPSWRGLAKARLPQQTFDEPLYAGWRSLRERDESRWLVLLANRIALRAAYGPAGEPVRGVAYQEGGPEAGLLGSAIWALGSVVTRSFARTGACLQISGSHHALVPDLPLLPTGPNDQPSPVEGVFGNERREDLEKIGLAVAQLYQRDIAFLGSVRTFHKPERYPDAEASADAAQQSTLTYQLFASRLVKFLGRKVSDLVGLGAVEAASHVLRDAVLQFLSTPEAPLGAERVGVVMKPNPKDATVTDVTLRVGPDLTIAGRPVNVLLNFQLRL